MTLTWRSRPALAFTAALLWAAQTVDAQGSASDAHAAAQSWVQLVDQGNGNESWGQAAASFRTVTPSEKWVASVQQVRRTLGSLQRRTLRRGAATDVLPTGQRGQFMLIEFDSEFTDRTGTSFETIALVRESDRQWRVVWYDIK